ncbi:unnamed protein product [Arctogadus glacialis]
MLSAMGKTSVVMIPSMLPMVTVLPPPPACPTPSFVWLVSRSTIVACVTFSFPLSRDGAANSARYSMRLSPWIIINADRPNLTDYHHRMPLESEELARDISGIVSQSFILCVL